MITTFIVSLVSGFLLSMVVHPVLRNLFRFRAEWTSTFVACMMTSLVTMVTFYTTFLILDKKTEFAASIAAAITLVIAFFAGLLAFRLIIKSESGRTLGWIISGMASLTVTLPPLVVLAILG